MLSSVSSDCCLRLGSSKLDGVVAKIIDGVPFSKEGVAEDGKWSTKNEVSFAIDLNRNTALLTLVLGYPFRRRMKCRSLEPQGCSRMG